jgi:DNA-binding transcriptional MerR regulator
MASPKREVYKAAEVCEVVQVPTYVLRSWEAEFPQIGQSSSGGGPRVYRRADIELVLRIKHLVFDEGLTLSGARRRLEEESDRETAPPLLVEDVLGARAREKLKNVKNGLQSILQLLSDNEAPAELRLVPPSEPAAKKKSAAKPGPKKRG